MKNDSDSNSQFSDDLSSLEKRLENRAKTAPSRPPNSQELFKRSSLFIEMERAVQYIDNFTHPYQEAFDLESQEGQHACKGFLRCLEKLFVILEVPFSNRDYRNQFSKAYRILYQENQLCYLTEILDSA